MCLPLATVSMFISVFLSTIPCMHAVLLSERELLKTTSKMSGLLACAAAILCCACLHTNAVTRFWSGASSETHVRNRQELYDVSKALEQAAKKRAPAGAGKQGKKSASIQQTAKRMADRSVDMRALPSDLRQSKSGASQKKLESVPSANEQTSGSVESPGEPALPTLLTCVCNLQVRVHGLQLRA